MNKFANYYNKSQLYYYFWRYFLDFTLRAVIESKQVPKWIPDLPGRAIMPIGNLHSHIFFNERVKTWIKFHPNLEVNHIHRDIAIPEQLSMNQLTLRGVDQVHFAILLELLMKRMRIAVLKISTGHTIWPL